MDLKLDITVVVRELTEGHDDRFKVGGGGGVLLPELSTTVTNSINKTRIVRFIHKVRFIDFKAYFHN